MRNLPSAIDHLPVLPDTLAIHGARQLLSAVGPLSELHALQVARLSLALFDGLASWHGLGTVARIELACAALLHDIGVSIREEQHHKWSYHLIMEKFWIVDPAVRKRVALMARYHRKALPKESHAEYQALDPAQKKVVFTGLACLRLADGLDRTHRAIARDLAVRLSPRHVQVAVQFLLDGTAETAAATKKADGLQALTGRPVILVPFDVGCPELATGTYG